MIRIIGMGCFILVAALALAGSETAAEPVAAPSDNTGNEAQLFPLDNGIQVLILPRPERLLAQVEVFVSLRGSADRVGMAHLVEHLMFTSSENCPGGSLRDSLQLLTTLEEASTSSRNVHTASRCLPELLPRLMMVEADRIGRLEPGEDDLALEVRRVMGEIDFRKEARTRQALFLRVGGMAFTEDDGGDPFTGSHENIGAVTLVDVDSFVAEFLRPDRTVVLVSGPVDIDEVVAMAEATFGTIPPADGPPPAMLDPVRPPARSYTVRTEDSTDMLAVGFRLPYRTAKEAAIVHLAETIMERENGQPILNLYGDEALLVVFISQDWTGEGKVGEGLDKATEQFWKETRTVVRNVGDSWHYRKNKEAHVKGFTKRLANPYRRASWRAQRLADGRDLPPPEDLAALVDTLSHERIHEYFAENFVPERAYVGFASGKTFRWSANIQRNRSIGFYVNPYLVPLAGSLGLGRADVDPILARAAGLGSSTVETVMLENGIPVHVLPVPDMKQVYLGGVRTFPALASESPDEKPGRLVLYGWTVNQGYDQKGARIEPEGESAGYDTWLAADVDAMTITSEGRSSSFDEVTAAMHKRIKVDRLHLYAYRWYKQQMPGWYAKWRKYAYWQAYKWRTAAVFGEGHPRVGNQNPDTTELQDWSLGKANKFHKEICRTGNLQLVLTGKVDPERAQAVLDPNFGDRPDRSQDYFPEAGAGITGVTGGVFHDKKARVATLEIMFPPHPIPTGGRAVDLAVADRLVENRLRIAVESAGWDSVSVYVHVGPSGGSAMGSLVVISPASLAGGVFDMVRNELPRLAAEPPDEDEEARARIAVMGPLLNAFQHGRTARDLLLEYGRLGQVPGDVVTELAEREYGVVGTWVASVFDAGRYAWTITANTGRLQGQDLGRVLNAEQVLDD